MSWREIWNSERAIYVNARHRALHFETIAKDILPLLPAPEGIVLDYGCGDTTAAEIIAAHCARLYLYDSSPKIEASLHARYAGAERISILSEAALQTLPDESLDMVICNGLFQYLSHEESRMVVAFAAKKLKLGGRILVSDVVPPYVDTVADSMALLDFAYRGGFFFAALRGMALMFFSRYRRLRGRVGLTTFTIPDMLRLLSIEGFEARRIDQNIGHNRARMTFIGKRL